MKGFDLLITLKDDCVFSERNATSGAHKALDYIPGGALLGVAASQLYKAQTSDSAFELFHSGKVRFTNAYPLDKAGCRTYPVPACWHDAKNDSSMSDGQIDPAKVWRLDKCEGGKIDNDAQPKQLRDGYFTLSGSVSKPEKQLRIKTAIDPKTGRAKEAALFGYDALKAGQRFYAQVQLDDDISDEALNEIKQVFSQSILLGRSRSAEYGRANVEVLERSSAFVSGEPDGNKVTLWLQSDLMVLDAFGQPTLCPSATDLGLPEGRFIERESFLRTRRYSTWNAYKRGYEMERQVICKGAVLVYELKEALNEQHRLTLANGVGLERQAGLGQLWLNPSILASKKPKFESEGVALLKSPSVSDTTAPEKSALINWLESKANSSQDNQENAAAARKESRSYFGFMRSARKLQGLGDDVFVGPSQSQWGGLQSQLKSHEDLEILMAKADGSFKAKGEGWKDEFQFEGRITTFYDWFKSHAKGKNHDYLSRLVREISNKIKSEQGGQS